jgi:hypothetical protein
LSCPLPLRSRTSPSAPSTRPPIHI